jgi:hypothetical protein
MVRRAQLRVDTRWSGGDVARLRKGAAELVAIGLDVAVAGVGPTTQALQQVSRDLPIVMAQAAKTKKQQDIIFAMARSWETLAAQAERLERQKAVEARKAFAAPKGYSGA